MLTFIKNLFGAGASTNYTDLMAQGAQIVDVRTKNEFQTGHIKGAINIPLNALQNQLSKLKKDKPIITCCASGMRSASAKSMLLSAGFTMVYNGGGWQSLQYKLK